MKNRFIVLVEFSNASANLLKLAHQLALINRIPLVVVHQSLSPVPGIGETTLIGAIKKDISENSLQQLQEFVMQTIGPSVIITYEVTTSNLAEAVLNLQTSDKADIVFTGIKHKDFIDKILFGSTAVKISDHTDNIIISVPDGYSTIDLSTLNIGIVECYPINVEALKNLLLITPHVNKLNFFSVVRSDEDKNPVYELLKGIAQQLKGTVTCVYEVVEAEKIIDGIKNYSSLQGGVLVLQKGTRNFSDVFRTQVVNEVVYSAELPVIILPETQRIAASQ